MSKYNPIHHKSIVDNVRAEAKVVGVDTSHISDERVFAIFEECYFDVEPEKERILILSEEPK